ncbi:MAG: sulfurtransferase TusA family protein [Proteobacteria bacterium]|nr:sulfurtransferase TusA family protein [Pseudomonadota bacterium]
MSFVDEKLIDLTLYGCPMHYIKAREAVQNIEKGESLLLLVNSGEAVDDVLKSLRQDGQLCEITAEKSLQTTIKISRKL